jgi:hypothetical protein
MFNATSKWVCCIPSCKHEAWIAGPGAGLLFLGWAVDEAEKVLYCPDHHPQGQQFMESQLIATKLFMRIAHRMDPANPQFDPTLLADLYRIAGDVAAADEQDFYPTDS